MLLLGQETDVNESRFHFPVRQICLRCHPAPWRLTTPSLSLRLPPREITRVITLTPGWKNFKSGGAQFPFCVAHVEAFRGRGSPDLGFSGTFHGASLLYSIVLTVDELATFLLLKQKVSKCNYFFLQNAKKTKYLSKHNFQVFDRKHVAHYL